ncbi:MAG: TIR domain-containing protein [Lachnospiraceae bacterium]|nr:TIR domain-containing protein [Lachnospiraceae bacterium]
MHFIPYFKQKKALFGHTHIMILELERNELITEIADIITDDTDCCFWRIDNGTREKPVSIPVSESGEDMEQEDKYRLDGASILPKMSLILAYVAGDCLEGGNYITDELLPLALKNGIPVIPLVRHEDDESREKYKKIFGRIQYINLLRGDAPEEIKQRITERIADVSIEEKIYNEIRENIENGFFLSYRKKDRAEALLIIDAVRNDERMKRELIWFDDLLTLGEDYSVEIDERIKACKAFILVITQRVLEEGNYVRKIEYPRAAKLGKLIIPIACDESIDEALVKEAFDSIPPVLLISDPDFNKKFRERVTGILKEDGEPDAKDLYYIGMANLYGVETQKDYKIAFEMFESSAKLEYPDAYKRLRNCYVKGCGTQRSLPDAIVWQKKLLAISEEKYLAVKSRKPESVEDRIHMFTDMMEVIDNYGADMARLTDLYRANGDRELDISTMKKYLELTDEMTHIFGPWVLRKTDALSWLAKHVPEEREYYYNELEKTVSEIDLSGEERNTANIGSVFLDLGNYHFDNGDLDKAVPFYEKVVEIELPRFMQYSEMEENILVQESFNSIGYNIIDACHKIAYCDMMEKKYEDAEGATGIAIKVVKTLLDYDSRPQNILKAMRTYQLMNILGEKQHDIMESLNAAYEIINLAEYIDPDENDYADITLYCYGLIYNYLPEDEDVEIVDDILRNILVYTDEILDNRMKSLTKYNLADTDRALTKAAVILEKKGLEFEDRDANEAIFYIAKSYKIWDKMLEAKIPCVWDLMLTAFKLQNVYIEGGYFEDAKRIIERMCELEKDVEDEYTEAKHQLIATVKMNMLRLLITLGETDELPDYIIGAMVEFEHIRDTASDERVKKAAIEKIDLLRSLASFDDDEFYDDEEFYEDEEDEEDE